MISIRFRQMWVRSGRVMWKKMSSMGTLQPGFASCIMTCSGVSRSHMTVDSAWVRVMLGVLIVSMGGHE